MVPCVNLVTLLAIRTSVPAAQINTQWETCQARSQACLLDFADPYDPEAAMPPNECHQGSVSTYYVPPLPFFPSSLH